MADSTNAAKKKLCEALSSLYHEADCGIVIYFNEEECEIIADHLLSRGIGLDAENTFNNVLILPCSIGDTLYSPVFTKDGKGSHIRERLCAGIHISDKVTRWRVDKPVRYFVLKTDDGHSFHVKMDELGRTLFLTREEAEAALRKGRASFEDD